MNTLSHIKLKYNKLELEIYGTEDFIEKQLSNIEFTINKLSCLSSDHSCDVTNDSSGNLSKLKPKPNCLSIEEIFKKDFSIWKKAFDKNTDDTVIYLIAGYYIQLGNNKNTFTNNAVSKLLSEHKLDIKNVGKCEKHNIKVSNIITVNSKGKYNENRLNKDAIEVIHDLLDLSLNDI
ncbi:MAG: hypothetical protein FH753_18590 [Firmicutes bacterium]|nr:hypothetical protein [Bacillota bacterium]